MKRVGLTWSVAILISMCVACSDQSPTAPAPAPIPPSTFTLSGLVFTVTPSGRVPVGGARVRVVGTAGGEATTDEDGTYTVSGLYSFSGRISTSKNGYETNTVDVAISGDRRLDQQLDIEIVPLVAYTLSGFVFEMTPDGRMPLEGVHLHYSETHEDVTTDAQGFYSFKVFRGASPLLVSKDGYHFIAAQLSVTGDTRFDIALVKE